MQSIKLVTQTAACFVKECVSFSIINSYPGYIKMSFLVYSQSISSNFFNLIKEDYYV